MITITIMIFYIVHLKTSREALEPQQRVLLQLVPSEYFQRSPTRSMGRGDIQKPDKQTKL